MYNARRGAKKRMKDVKMSEQKNIKYQKSIEKITNFLEELSFDFELDESASFKKILIPDLVIQVRINENGNKINCLEPVENSKIVNHDIMNNFRIDLNHTDLISDKKAIKLISYIIGYLYPEIYKKVDKTAKKYYFHPLNVVSRLKWRFFDEC